MVSIEYGIRQQGDMNISNLQKSTPNLAQSLLSFFCFYLLDSLVGFSPLVGQAPPKELPRLHRKPRRRPVPAVRASWIALLTYPIKMKWKLSQRCSMGKLVVSHPTWKKAACVWCVLNRVNDPRFPRYDSESLRSTVSVRRIQSIRFRTC